MRGGCSGGIRRRLTLGLAVLTGAGLLAVAGPGTGTAEAASSLCSGRKVRTLDFATGEVRVYRSRGFVCAVAYTERPGVRRTMSVSVQARGSRAVRDKGSFVHHAGPVTVHAGNRCVLIKGSVGRSSVSSGWILC